MCRRKGNTIMVITFSNIKGGCSKSTSTFVVSEILRTRGQKQNQQKQNQQKQNQNCNVLTIDMDPQASLSMLLNLDDSRTIVDALKGKFKITEVVQTSYNGDAIAGSAELPLLSDKEIFRLKDILKEIEPYYDYIIIDSTPTLSKVLLSILYATDKLVIPATTSLPVILAIRQFGDLIKLAKQQNPKLDVAGILMTMYDKRLLVGKAMLETANEIAKGIGTKVFETSIRKGVAVEEAFASFKGLIEYDKNSKPALDYVSFVQELGV